MVALATETSFSPHPRTETLRRNWWVVGLRGMFAILFGAIAILDPGLALSSLVLLFAIYLLADGFAATIAACRAASRHHRWGELALEGIAGILVGCVVLAIPGITMLLFVALMAIWAVFSGTMMIAGAFRLKGGRGRLPFAAGGTLSVGWGILLLLWPITGATVLAIWLGAYVILFGVSMLLLAYRLRHRAPA